MRRCTLLQQTFLLFFCIGVSSGTRLIAVKGRLICPDDEVTRVKVALWQDDLATGESRLLEAERHHNFKNTHLFVIGAVTDYLEIHKQYLNISDNCGGRDKSRRYDVHLRRDEETFHIDINLKTGHYNHRPFDGSSRAEYDRRHPTYKDAIVGGTETDYHKNSDSSIHFALFNAFALSLMFRIIS